MLECFLVVAMSYNGVLLGRSFETIQNVPQANVQTIMSFEVGRGMATQVALNPRAAGGERVYGYDCGEGWVDRGLKQQDVFSG